MDGVEATGVVVAGPFHEVVSRSESVDKGHFIDYR